MTEKSVAKSEEIDFITFKNQVLADYKLACESREASLLGRKEVLTGKAKFGIFGDGKELAQLALAKQFKNGDFRSGYYRDQTWMMAINQLDLTQYFSGLYAHTDIEADPQSGGRQMGGHYSTRNLDKNGNWKNLMEQKNSSSDISPTAGQMPRMLGLAMASKVYKNNLDLQKNTSFDKFSNKGNEVVFGSIGDASTSEGPFWETVNAAGVMQVPLVLSVWDDGYGISVPRKYQTTKNSISDALAGMQRSDDAEGFDIYVTKGWDYPHLCKTYEKAVSIAREKHIPVLVHVKEVNQPQGHSTSGSHERYKSTERMEWEKEFDCIHKFRQWILSFKETNGNIIASEEELNQLEKEAKETVRSAKKSAWNSFSSEIKKDLEQAVGLIQKTASGSKNNAFILKIAEDLSKTFEPIRKDILSACRKTLRLTTNENFVEKENLSNWVKNQISINYERYSSHLHSESDKSALKVKHVPAIYSGEETMVDGRIILKNNYEKLLEKTPELLIYGEDVGKIGGVNQTLEGMQEKFGEHRVFDTGIRECTIVGQGIGMAMRGLRPIAEIQYLDYLLYALQVMSDDLATVQYRTKGGQKAPLIISTRGHRLEGIWHSGSPLGMIVNSLRGLYVCVPRNMTKAAGFYNTLLNSDEPALVIEPLNGYRSKERLPDNVGEYNEPLGVPEVVQNGTDISIVSYGSTFNICLTAAKELESIGVSCEVIDIQTLIPFDINNKISKSLEKTNRLLVVDEDVSSGATAYILDQILVKQKGYYLLDSAPETLSAKDHRPAYGTDGDYFSKPSMDDIIEKTYEIMHEFDPEKYPSIY